MTSPQPRQPSGNTWGGQFAKKHHPDTFYKAIHLHDVLMPDPQDWFDDPQRAKALRSPDRKPDLERTAVFIQKIVKAALDDPIPEEITRGEDIKIIVALDIMTRIAASVPDHTDITQHAFEGTVELLECPTSKQITDVDHYVTRVITDMETELETQAQARYERLHGRRIIRVS